MEKQEAPRRKPTFKSTKHIEDSTLEQLLSSSRSFENSTSLVPFSAASTLQSSSYTEPEITIVVPAPNLPATQGKETKHMGTYMVNGHPVDLSGNNPTAGDLKKQLGSPASHSVVVTLPDGSEHHMQDHEPIPINAADVSVLPTFRYGS